MISFAFLEDDEIENKTDWAYHHEIKLGLMVWGRVSFLGMILAEMPNLPDSASVTSPM